MKQLKSYRDLNRLPKVGDLFKAKVCPHNPTMYYIALEVSESGCHCMSLGTEPPNLKGYGKYRYGNPRIAMFHFERYYAPLEQ